MDNSVMENVSDTNQAQVNETPAAAQERLFKQSELNDIVGKRVNEAVESYKRQNQQTQQPQSQQVNHTQSSGLSEDDVKRLTSEELARQREQWSREVQEKADAEMAQRIVNSYKEKIAP